MQRKTIRLTYQSLSFLKKKKTTIFWMTKTKWNSLCNQFFAICYGFNIFESVSVFESDSVEIVFFCFVCDLQFEVCACSILLKHVVYKQQVIWPYSIDCYVISIECTLLVKNGKQDLLKPHDAA